MLPAAAAASSTSAAFCWVTASISVMAVLTWPMPVRCSAEASAMAAMTAFTRATLATTSCIVAPARPAMSVPVAMLVTLASIRALISLAAVALRWARLRTSLATTANPRPWSPARAASTAAFSARILVWNAMPSITPMIATMRPALPWMASMVPTTWPTAPPPRRAVSEADTASRWAWPALSAFRATACVSCSIDAAVSSSALACASVRLERSILPAAICAAAVAMVSELARIAAIMPARFSCMVRIANSRLERSAGAVSTRTLRSRAAIFIATSAAYSGLPPMARCRLRLTATTIAASTAHARAITSSACFSAA